jgi:hypothetical protein
MLLYGDNCLRWPLQAEIFPNATRSRPSPSCAVGTLRAELDPKPVHTIARFLYCSGVLVPCRVLRLCLLREFLREANFIVFERVLVAVEPLKIDNVDQLRTYITTSVILTGFAGRSVPSLRGSLSSVSRTSSPPTSLPKTVCFLSRFGVGLNVI